MTTNNPLSHDAMGRSYGLGLLAILALWTLYRAVLLATDQSLSLYVDEAYYWVWSQAPDFGYYSKPPMIAWSIGGVTALLGDSQLGVKSLALFVYPFTAVAFFLLARYLFDVRVAFFSTLAFITLPGVTLSSVIASTDVLLFFFWTLSLYAFVRAVNENTWRYWVLLGLAGGLGLLSKYTMGIFAVSVLIALCTVPAYRQHLLNYRLYLAAVLAFLLFLPNIFWNIQHRFPTLQHTYEISRLENTGLHWGELGEFLAGQFSVMGPVGFFVFLALLAGLLIPRGPVVPSQGPQHTGLLLSFSLPFLLIISLQGLLGRANANWAAPTYVAATLWVISRLLQAGRTKWLTAVFAANILLGLAVFHYHTIVQVLGIELTRQTDPYKRVKGWEAFAYEVTTLLNAHPKTKLLSGSRSVLSHVAFYSQPHRLDGVSWNPESQIRHQFDLVTNMADHIGEDFIYVTQKTDVSDLQSRFDSVAFLKEIHIPIHRDFAITYQAYLARGFKGY